MTPFVMWLALTCGVDAGYEPGTDGRLEYIIQIEPQLLRSLGAGNDITSEVPPGLEVRHYRITLGNAQLPRIAAPVGQQPSTFAGGNGRAADQFEQQGRTDEAVNSTTPQIRVGYQALVPSGGLYSIQIDPVALGDLQHSDFTGDIPPGLPVTRFLVSTKRGTIPPPAPAANQQIPLVASGGAATVTAGTPPPGVDEDPGSSWQKPSAQLEVQPPVVADIPPETPPPANVAGMPDDAVNGAFQPPPADPPPPGEASEEHLHLGDHKRPHEPSAADKPPALGNVPGSLPNQADSVPLVTTSANDELPVQNRSTHKHPQPPADPEETDEPPPRFDAGSPKSEPKATEAPKQWFPLTITLLILFASLGGNVFLGWIAWDSYNRGRPMTNKFAGAKSS